MVRSETCPDTTFWTPEDLDPSLRATAPSDDAVFAKADPGVTTSPTSTTHSSEDPALEADLLATDVSKPIAAPELDAAAKRSRRTEIERLSRRRRQATLRGMRDEVRALEAKFAGLMEGHAVRKRATQKNTGYFPGTIPIDSDESVGALNSSDDGLSDVKYIDQIRRLRERFIELKLQEGELEHEQQDLQRNLRGKQLLAMSIQSVAFSGVRTWSDPEQPAPAREVTFKFLPADEYARLMRAAYDELLALEATTAFESVGSIGGCMGWTHRRATDDSRFVFSLSKAFEGREAEPIVRESWDVFSSESRLRQAFSHWGVNAQQRVVERPRDDLLVIHRCHVRRGCRGERRHHVVFLLFRVRTTDGYTLCMRSVPALQTELEPPAHWTGIFTWLHFRDVATADGARRCEVEYYNYMPNLRRRPVDKLFVAFLSTVVRWEAACAAARLLAAA